MNYEEVINDISNINNTTLATLVRAVNKILTIRNSLIGAYIFEYEQNGVDRAAYGTQLIKKLADDLTSRKIESLSDRNLKNFRQFALNYPALAKNDNISAILSEVSIPLNQLQIRQAVTAEFRTSANNLFPALVSRELQNPSLIWQDNNYYQSLFSRISLIAIDLKLGKFKHDYAGQMNFYLNYLRENVAYPHENYPVGILLCAEKDAEEVYYATAGLDNQLFVSRYMVALPSEETLKQWLKEEQDRLEKQFDFGSTKKRDS